MTSYTVTATQVNNPFNGIFLQVLVLNGAAAATSQPGGTGHDIVGGCTVPITTTTAGSVIYGAAMCDDALAMTFESNSTPFSGALPNPFHDTTNDNYYATWYTAATVTPGGPTNYGCSASGAGSACGAEILPNGTITIDASSPAMVETNNAETIQTASFVPPAGTLLVALVPSDGTGSGVTTMSVTSSPSLTWTELINSNAGDYEYTGVWIAQVPAGPAGAPSVFYPRPASRVVTVPFTAGRQGAGHSR